MKGYRVTRVPNFFEYIRIACPICGRTGGCMVNGEGDRVVCIRIESKTPFSKNSSLPSWLHYLKEKQPKINTDHVAEMGHEKLDDFKLDEVFTTMLDYMELTDEHYKHLTSTSRGFNDEQIMIRGYSSFPNSPWNLARAVQNDLGMNSFAGIPGFFEAVGKENGSYWSITGREGILIPYRNNKNQITGFQYRIDNPPLVANIKQMSGIYGLNAINDGNKVTVSLEGEIIFQKEMALDETVSLTDDNDKTLGFVSLKQGGRYYWLSSANRKNGTGAGSPSPVHVSVPTSDLKQWKAGTSVKRKKIWLTEGALKADIASDMLSRNFNAEQLALYGDTFVAIPGVNAWQTVLPLLEEMEVEEINLAFDRDFTSNVYVMKSLKQFMAHAKEKGYHVNIAAWGKEDGKGIDDLLLLRKIPTITPIF